MGEPNGADNLSSCNDWGLPVRSKCDSATNAGTVVDYHSFQCAVDSSCGFFGALARGDRILWSGPLAPAGRRAEAEVLPNLIEALERQGCTLRDVRDWTVGVGPGSFTGLRSGIALVLGVCRGTGARVRGLPSSLALARSVAAGVPIGARIGVLHDARRAQVIVTVYRVTGPGTIEEVEPPRVRTVDEVAEASLSWNGAVTPHFSQLESLLPESVAGGCSRADGVDPRWFLAPPSPPWGGPDTAACLRSCMPIYVRPPVFVEPGQPRPCG